MEQKGAFVATEPEELDFEGHRNQALTSGAATKRTKTPTNKAPTKKVVALKLSLQEHRAFQELGGTDALKKLLHSQALCEEVRKLLQAVDGE